MGDHVAKMRAVNRAMERGERGETMGGDAVKNGRENGTGLSDASDAESDWLDDLPGDATVFKKGEYVCEQMCTNPKFLNALLKYM
jgi:hypothetical protein